MCEADDIYINAVLCVACWPVEAQATVSMLSSPLVKELCFFIYITPSTFSGLSDTLFICFRKIKIHATFALLMPVTLAQVRRYFCFRTGVGV